jgi:PIN domain nuclease of toxin-antitoxin system
VRLLLDSHAVIWAVDDPAQLGSRAVQVLQDPDNELLVSAGTLWELAIKVGLGKLALSLPFREWMQQAIDDLGATVLQITVEYADAQAGLMNHHRDPFDRLLIAQATVEQISIVSSDAAFDAYGVSRIW